MVKYTRGGREKKIENMQTMKIEDCLLSVLLSMKRNPPNMNIRDRIMATSSLWNFSYCFLYGETNTTAAVTITQSNMKKTEKVLSRVALYIK